MKRVVFELTMPSRGSWDGKWSGEEKNNIIYKNLTDKLAASIGLKEPGDTRSWMHRWSDGWAACVTARAMHVGEKKKKSAGFCGYDWMVENILCYNQTTVKSKEEVKT